MGKWIALLMLLTAGSAFAQTKDCLDKARVDSVLKTYKFQSYDSKSQRYVDDIGLDVCAADNLPRAAIRAILYLEDLPSMSNVGSLDSGLLKNPYQFFSSRIKRVLFDRDLKDSLCQQGGVLAYVNGEPEMHICDLLGTVTDAGDFADTIVHEARHVDGYSHVYCSHGDLRGQDLKINGACDASYQEHGSYGVDTELLVKLARAAAPNSPLRQAYRSEAVSSFISRFNQLPLGLKSELLLQSAAGEIVTFDGRSSQVLASGLPAESVLALRAGLPTVYDPVGGQVKSFLSSTEQVDAGGTFAKGFRALGQSQRREILDVNYQGTTDCLLYSHSVVCGDGVQPDQTVSLNAIRPKALVYSPASSIVKNKTLYIAAEDGFLYALPTDTKAFAGATEATFVRSSKPYSIMGLGSIRGQEYTLNFDGSVSMYSARAKRAQVVPALQGAKFVKMHGDFLWSQQLGDL